MLMKQQTATVLGATKYSVTSITVNAADCTVRRFTTVTPCFRAGREEVIRFS